jgi:nitrite reductase (NO-forming)
MSTELDERALAKLRDELQHVEDELHQIEGEAHSAHSASWVTVPLAGMAMVIGIAALILAVVFVRDNGSGTSTTVVSKKAKAAAPAPEAAKTVKFEPYKTPDPTLPAVPAGAVKKFKVDVFEHVTKVAADKPATQVWSFAVNGVAYRGTGASTPIVVNEGDKVQLTLVNGGSKEMGVTMPHSIDTHAAEVNPGEAFKSIGPGEKWSFSFVAKHPGVYMYHCATQPILMHTGSGMVGMLVVRPKGLTPAKEFWINQQEYYLGAAGGPASLTKMQAKNPDVIAFNGYANQYKDHPITVKRGERIRMYVMNAGPSIWTGFHVIGTVFDKTNVEGVVGRDSQTINLAPSQGGYVEFTLDKEGSYPFLTHAFGDMVKGAIGVLATTHAPKAAEEGHSMGGHAPAKVAPAAGGIKTELGEMYVKPAQSQIKAGKVTFIAHNAGTLPHMLMVEKTPLKMDAPGQPSESAALADTGIIQPGETKSITVTLKKGEYELFCNVPGHYAAGQTTTVSVS